MKRVLITGGAGFIGSNLAVQLVKKGYSVTVLDNLSPQIHGENVETDSGLYRNIKDLVRFVKGSVTEKQDWLKVIQQQDIIVHYAAATGTGQSMYEIENYTKVNIGGTAIMLDLLTNTKHSVKKVIVASSRAIYGEGKYLDSKNGVVYPKCRNAKDMDRGDFDVKIEESSGKLILQATDEYSKIHPTSVYGITKQNQEQMIMTVCPAIGIAPVAFRYQNVYGPGQSLRNPYTGILSIFSTRIKNGNELNIFEDGMESRDFVYIDDVVDATILGIENAAADNEVFNVGTGGATTVLTVAKTLIKTLQIDVPITISGNYRIGDIRHNYADLNKISQRLGYKPKVQFEEGIKLFCRWVENQSAAIDKYEESIEELRKKGLYK